MKTASFLAMLLGITGASLLSFDFEHRNLGYIPFLISAILSCIVLYKKDHYLLTLNAIFAVININGIYQFIL